MTITETTGTKQGETTSAATATGDKLVGRVALVTGGTRGIGAAICTSLASQGAEIAAGFSGNTTQAEKFASDFQQQFGTPATVHRGNVASADDCRRVIAEVIEQHGRLDILVNNAGITIDKTVLKLTDDDWHKVLDVNLSGAFFLSQAALRHMVERGSGRIINVSSIIGEIGNIGQANYAASKSGLFGLTKTLAREAAFHLERAGKLSEDSVGCHGQHRDTWIHRNRDGRCGTGEGAQQDQGADPASPPRPPGGNRPDRALPCRGRLLVHHRTSLGSQWRDGHVIRAMSLRVTTHRMD